MPQEIQLQVLPEVAASNHLLVDLVAKLTQTSSGEVQHITILKRSIDARQKQVKINLKIQVFFQGEDVVHRNIDFPNYKNVKDRKSTRLNSSHVRISYAVFCLKKKKKKK